MKTISLPKCCILLLLLLFSVTSCSSGSSAPKAKVPTYTIGYMICNSKQETLHRFVPLTAWLSKKLGVHFKPVAIDTTVFTRHVDHLDFTHTNSLLYIIMHQFYGVDVLAAESKGPLGPRSRGIIVVRKDSGIKTLKDLKGKTMLFGPPLAPTGFMSQIYLLQQAGVDPDKDLAFYAIPPGAYKHEKVIYGVMFKKYDAGASPYYDFVKMAKEGKINRNNFKIIGEGPIMPYCNFAVTEKTDDKLAARFKAALLSLTPEDTVEIDGERLKVLKQAGIKGYQNITDKDFDIVRKIAKRTNMPPYQKY